MTQPSESARRRAKELFEELVDLPIARRQAEMDRLAPDSAVRSEVVSLLRSHDEAEAFMDDPTLPPAEEAGAASRLEEVGSQVGPYRLVRRLGEGGFGTVFLAEQERPVRRRVALKLIKLGMDTKQVVARFEAERQALAIMEHPNIARVFDAGATETGRPYFVMELVQGVPITRYCDEHRLSLRQRLELFVQVLQAVQHAHTKGVIHRDIKPSNVLVAEVDGQATPKVIDFGVAKATEASLTERTLLTEQRQLIGTPEYMSPEQAEMNSRDVDTRSDIYSLGVVLYELLTGTTPFDGRELRSKAFSDMQRTIREVDPPRPSTRLDQMRHTLDDIAGRRRLDPQRLRRMLRGELDVVVMKCLEKERHRRYETAAAVAEDVLAYLNDQPVSAAAPSNAYLLRKLVRRNRGPVTAAAAVLLVLLVGIAGTSIGLVGQIRLRALAERRGNDAQRQTEEARRQAAISDAVQRFQNDMFAAADPGRLLGRDLKVIDVMAAAEKELDRGKLADQPLVEASVRHMIGWTYSGLGDLESAERNNRRALDLRLERLPHSSAAIAETRQVLGAVLSRAGKRQEAEALFRQAILDYKPATELDSTNAANLYNLATLLHEQGQFEEAESLHRRALAIRQGRIEQDPMQAAESFVALGVLLMGRGKLDEAEPLLRDGVAVHRRMLAPEHPDLATALSSLGGLLWNRGEVPGAEALLREVHEIRSKSLPPNHPDLATSAGNMASILWAQEKLADAEVFAHQALEIRRVSLPEDHPHIIANLSLLAGLAHGQGRLEDAESFYRQALEGARRSLPAGHPERCWILLRFAMLLQDQGNASDAEPLCREAIAGFQATYGVTWRYGRGQLELGRILASQGLFGDAEAALLEAERLLADAGNAAGPHHDRCLEALASLYSDWETADPGNGHAAQASTWKARVPATQPVLD